jgi:hypothetical protein
MGSWVHVHVHVHVHVYGLVGRLERAANVRIVAVLTWT